MPKKKEKTPHDTKYICPICGDRIDRKFLATHVAAEEYVLKKIREAHPEWVQQNGACPKCWENYKTLNSGDSE